MADTTITNLPNASALTGAERVPMDQAGATVDASTQQIADLSATAISTAVANHVAAADPHPGYLTQAEGDARYDLQAAATAFTVRALVRNNSGASIAKGVPVYVTGSSGTTITVAPADASTEATASQTLGLMEATTANNADGYVVAVGLLTGLNTSALSEGQIVWLSETTGGLTTTRPTQPAHGVVVGYCVKQAAGAAGEIYVKVDNGLELAELHDVLLTGATTGQVLRLASDGLWKPATLGTFATADAATPPAIGGTTPAAGAFSVLTATAELTLPGAAPGTPAVGDLYRVVNTLRYRDSTSAERLLLNATDNLANLASPATARANLGAAATPNWYKIGNWFTPVNTVAANGGSFLVNRIYLTPFSVNRAVSINELGARVTTALAASLFQLAIYGSSAGLPTGLPLAATADMSGATATVLSAVVTQFTLQPGEIYWMSANVSGTGNTLTFLSPSVNSTYHSAMIGGETLATISSAATNVQWNRWVSQTYGTWPDLTSVSTALIASNLAPIVFMKVAALP